MTKLHIRILRYPNIAFEIGRLDRKMMFFMEVQCDVIDIFHFRQYTLLAIYKNLITNKSRIIWQPCLISPDIRFLVDIPVRWRHLKLRGQAHTRADRDLLTIWATNRILRSKVALSARRGGWWGDREIQGEGRTSTRHNWITSASYVDQNPDIWGY